jgi:hypothetical protein
MVMHHGARLSVRLCLTRTMASLIGIILTPLAFAQSCGNYKNQLESLLVLPAGKYRVEEFRGSTEQKTITLKDERTAWLDAAGYPKESPEPDGRVTVQTYLEYSLQRSALKVVDSTTKGRRVANGRLSCVYVVSYPPLNRQTSLGIDVQVSDSGRAEFFAPTLMTSLMLGDNPNAYEQLTAKEGAGVAFSLISYGLRERDKSHPGLQESAGKSYAEMLAKAQAKQDEERPKYQHLVTECQAILIKAKREIEEKQRDPLDGWGRKEKTEYWDRRFDGKCHFSGLPKPSQWIANGAKPFDSPSSPPNVVQQATPSALPTTETAQDNTTPTPPFKSPKEACAKKSNFVSHAICVSKACMKPEYQGHPDCPTTQPTGGQL